MPHRTLVDVLASVADQFTVNGEEYQPAIDERNACEDTPLHVVAWRNDVEAAGILIAAGADVNALGDMSCTPLYVAVAKKNPEMIQCLLDAGADPDAISEFNTKALPAELRMPFAELKRYFERVKINEPKDENSIVSLFQRCSAGTLSLDDFQTRIKQVVDEQHKPGPVGG